MRCPVICPLIRIASTPRYCGAPRAHGDRAIPEAAREFRRDVAEHRDRAGADLLAIGGDRPEVGLHQAEIALEDPGEDLADEGGAGRACDREARDRVPDEVDTERPGDEVTHLTDDRRHACGNLGPDVHLIRQVRLVAEQKSVDTGRLQRLEVAFDGLHEVSHPGCAIVAGATRHRRKVEHRDDRLVHAEHSTQQSHAGLRTSVRRVRPFSIGRSSDVSDPATTTSMPACSMRSISSASALLSVTMVETCSIGDHGAHRHRTELRAVGDDDDPFGALETATDHVGVAIVELGDPTACGEPGGADHRGVGVVAAHRLDGRCADAGQLVLANQTARDDDAHIAGPKQARHRERRRDHHEVFAHREESSEMLDGRADPKEHRAHAHGQLGRALGDDSLLPCVVQRSCVGADLEGPDEVRRGTAVGSSHETVALEPAQIAPYGHLGNLEVASQRADLDRLVLRNPLKHLQAPLDR